MTEGDSVSEADEDKHEVVIVDNHVLVRSGLEVVFGRRRHRAGGSGRRRRRGGPAVCRAPARRRPHGPGDARPLGCRGDAEGPRDVPGTRVVALTSFTDEDLIGKKLRASATGYLMKNVSAEQLAEAVRAGTRGNRRWPPKSPTRSCGRPPRRGRRRLAHCAGAQALKLMADGLTNADIAERLVIGVITSQDAREQRHLQARRVHADGGHCAAIRRGLV